MSDVRLEVYRRSLAKKKVGQLRAQGFIPGVISGHGFASVPIQVVAKDFEAVFKRIHGTAMFELSLEGEPMQTLVHGLQRDKLTHKVRHIDFLKVNLKERVAVEVPLILTGTSPLEEAGLGMVSQQSMVLHIRCLPEDIPDEIAVERSLIKTKEGVIHAADIPLPAGVTLATEAEKERVLAAFMAARVHEAKAEATKEGEAAPPKEEIS